MTQSSKCAQDSTNPPHLHLCYLIQASVSHLDSCSCLLTGLHKAANVLLLHQPLCSKPSLQWLSCWSEEQCPWGHLWSKSHHCLDFLPPSLPHAQFFPGMLLPMGFYTCCFPLPGTLHADTYMAFSVDTFMSLLKCLLSQWGLPWMPHLELQCLPPIDSVFLPSFPLLWKSIDYHFTCCIFICCPFSSITKLAGVHFPPLECNGLNWTLTQSYVQVLASSTYDFILFGSKLFTD